MEPYNHNRVVLANQELRNFVRQLERLSERRASLPEPDIHSIHARLLNDSPEVGDAARVETLDSNLQSEFCEYVRNLRALQSVLEKVQSP